MKTIEVVAAIIEEDGQILATERGYGEYAGGWEFPGGKVETGETPEEALVREIDEELAVKIEIDRFVMTVDYDYETFHLTMHCYLARLTQGETITLLEHSAAQWVNRESIDAINWLPADIAVVNELKSQSII